MFILYAMCQRGEHGVDLKFKFKVEKEGGFKMKKNNSHPFFKFLTSKDWAQASWLAWQPSHECRTQDWEIGLMFQYLRTELAIVGLAGRLSQYEKINICRTSLYN